MGQVLRIAERNGVLVRTVVAVQGDGTATLMCLGLHKLGDWSTGATPPAG